MLHPDLPRTASCPSTSSRSLSSPLARSPVPNPSCHPEDSSQGEYAASNHPQAHL
ncbi:hypothetical protein BS47DRAFT_1356064, partial [Hydnum rufescens UP504]